MLYNSTFRVFNRGIINNERERVRPMLNLLEDRDLDILRNLYDFNMEKTNSISVEDCNLKARTPKEKFRELGYRINKLITLECITFEGDLNTVLVRRGETGGEYQNNFCDIRFEKLKITDFGIDILFDIQENKIELRYSV